MSDSIDVIGTTTSLTSLWGSRESLFRYSWIYQRFDWTQNNDLIGLIPDSLASLKLNKVDLNNNHFIGYIPTFKTSNVTKPILSIGSQCSMCTWNHEISTQYNVLSLGWAWSIIEDMNLRCSLEDVKFRV